MAKRRRYSVILYRRFGILVTKCMIKIFLEPTLPAPSSVAPMPACYGQGPTVAMPDRCQRSEEDLMR